MFVFISSGPMKWSVPDTCSFNEIKKQRRGMSPDKMSLAPISVFYTNNLASIDRQKCLGRSFGIRVGDCEIFL